MKLLVVGSGGREMSIYKKSKQSKRFTEVFQCPYNSCFETSVSIETNKEIVDFCVQEKIDLVIIGPENYLYDDLATDLEFENIKVFGPNKSAAKIEWSKSFAKDLMAKYDIPTAKYEAFINLESSLAFLEKCSYPLVIKEDGLASGKGVYILANEDEAKETLEELYKINSLAKIVIEEFLVGEELSLFAMVDGPRYKLLPAMKDYKRIFDNDEGPNTGGMGARTFNKYDDKINEIEKEIVLPMVNCLVKENIKYTGIIYFGFMYANNKFYVIEFNARFGDPETEVLMEKLKTNVADMIYDFLSGKEIEIETYPEEFIGTVLASKGYPGEYKKGMEMDFSNVNLVEMNMIKKDGKYFANGGRVAIVISKGNTIEEAKSNLYNDLENVSFDNMYFRKDIGK